MAPASLVVLVVVVLAALVGGRLWRYGYSDITPEFSTPPSLPISLVPTAWATTAWPECFAARRSRCRSVCWQRSCPRLSARSTGYYRGWVDSVLMRFTDLLMTIPRIAILIVMAGRVRGNKGNWWAIALIIAAVSWTPHRPGRAGRGPVAPGAGVCRGGPGHRGEHEPHHGPSFATPRRRPRHRSSHIRRRGRNLRRDRNLLLGPRHQPSRHVAGRARRRRRGRDLPAHGYFTSPGSSSPSSW